MTTTLYAYSGTGNSLWAAKVLAGHLGDAEILPFLGSDAPPAKCTSQVIGFLFPVHMWGIPRRARLFIERLETPADAYHFAVAVNAGQVSRTLIQLDELLKNRGRFLSSGFSLLMPSNYLPWGGPGTKELVESRIATSREKLADVASCVARREKGPVERGPLWQRVLFTALYKMSFSKVPTMDRGFWLNDACNGCGTCAKVCPSGNVTLVDGKPRWSGKCEQCLACIQWCPKQALQYGKKTPGFERYHHPEVRLSDLLSHVQAGRRAA